MFLLNVKLFRIWPIKENWSKIWTSLISSASLIFLKYSVADWLLGFFQACILFDIRSLWSLSVVFFIHSSLCFAIRTAENSTIVPKTKRRDVNRYRLNLFDFDWEGLSCCKKELIKFQILTKLKMRTIKPKSTY